MSAALPEQIGSYRVLGLLGEGSSGRVYRAQEPGTGREVALKVLRAGFVGEAFEARFRREIALLAALEHPGIARLYSAGEMSTEAGALPYLAMEYVRGRDLMAYAEAERLSLAARLRLVVRICEAVHHAHTRGIVHRDLKPANVLVDASGQPRVLDFGIAQVSHGGESETVTRIGEVLGTLPYMSWEQLAGEPGAIDPRADVFALGVMAYQLLSGRLPYPGAEGTTLMQVMKERHARQPPPLCKTVPAARGDIETMVMKAMAFDAAQRYGSAAEFAQDLGRYLDHRPIEARPPTVSYVARLFMRRHKTLAAAALVVVVALLGGSVVSLRFALAERQARAQAEQRVSELDAVNDFLSRMFRAADPLQAKGPALTVREVLRDARQTLEQDDRLSPAVTAQLMNTLGSTYLSVQEMSPALSLLQAANQRLAALYPEDDPVMLRNRLDLATALAIDGRLVEARARFEPLLATLRTHPEVAPRLQLEARFLAAEHLVQNGGTEAERAETRQLHADAVRALGPDDPLTLAIAIAYGHQLYMTGEWAEALARIEPLVESLKNASTPQEKALRLDAQSQLGKLLRDRGRLAESEAVLRGVEADTEALLGPHHANTLFVRQYHIGVLLLMGREAEAAPEAEAVLGDLRRLFGDTATAVQNARAMLARVRWKLGDGDAALQLLREGLALAAAQKVSPRSAMPWLQVTLADVLLSRNQRAEAAAHYAEAARTAAAEYGPAHPYSVYFRSLQVVAESDTPADTQRTLELALPLLQQAHGPDHPFVQRVAQLLQTARLSAASRTVAQRH